MGARDGPRAIAVERRRPPRPPRAQLLALSRATLRRGDEAARPRGASRAGHIAGLRGDAARAQRARATRSGSHAWRRGPRATGRRQDPRPSRPPADRPGTRHAADTLRFAAGGLRPGGQGARHPVGTAGVLVGQPHQQGFDARGARPRVGLERGAARRGNPVARRARGGRRGHRGAGLRHLVGRRPATDRDAFCRSVGLPPGRPYLLWLCSSAFIAPQELAFVRRWIEDLRAREGDLSTAGVLVRPHP